jgi:hypothetical protein
MTFTPGTKVACISTDNLGLLGYGDEVYPTLGETYTVREVVLDHFGAEGLLLNEIRNDRLPYRVGDKIVDFEKPFASWRFRPLVSKEGKKEMEAV